MAIRNLNRSNLDYHQGCILRLTASSPGQWGRMSPRQLCAHLNYMLRFSVGDDPHPRPMVPRFLQPVVWWLFFRIFTRWPHSVIKAPGFMTPQPKEDFMVEREALLAALERFVEALEATPERRVHSPALGNLTLREWSRVHGVHFRHHYRQFELLP